MMGLAAEAERFQSGGVCAEAQGVTALENEKGIFFCVQAEQRGEIVVVGCRPFDETAEFTVPGVLAGQRVAGVSDLNVPQCETLRFDEGIRYIDSLRGWRGFARVALPQSLESVGPSAFSGCTALQTLETAARSIGSRAFMDCAALERVTLTGTVSIGAEAFARCVSLREVRLPDSLVSMGADDSEECVRGAVFADCDRLASVFIGAGLQEMMGNPLRGCSALRAVHIAPENRRFILRDGLLIDRVERTLIAALPQGQKEQMTVPADVRCLERDALSGTCVRWVELPHEEITVREYGLFAERRLYWARRRVVSVEMLLQAAQG